MELTQTKSSDQVEHRDSLLTLLNLPVCISMLMLISLSSYATINGPSIVCNSNNTNYSFDNGNNIAAANWVITNGSVITSSSSGTLYSVTVQWTGSGTLTFKGKFITIDAISVTYYAAPNSYTVSGGGNACSGSLNVALSGSQSGVSYQLYKTPGPATYQSPQSGTGSALSWTVTDAGTYTVKALYGSGNCTMDMAGSAVATIDSPPTAYTVGGGGAYCFEGTGVSVTLSGSESGVSYQLRRLPHFDIGSPVSGTGSSLTWNNVIAAGTYIIIGTKGGCTTSMTGSAAVSTNDLPSSFTVGGGGSYCPGASGVTVTLSGSQTGVNYQLKIGGSNSGSPVSGTGSALSWTGQTTTETYTITATNATTGCSEAMAGSVNVTTYLPLTAYTVSGGGATCAGGSGVTVTLSSSVTGVNYQLKVNGSNVGSPAAGSTGTPINWNNNTTAGTYTMVATHATNGCSANMTGSASVTNPSITAYTVGGGGGYCPGSSATVTLSGSETGVTYKLKIGNILAMTYLDGTGSALSWPEQTTVNTYTVVATHTATGCTLTMTGSVNVTANSALTDFNVSGGGSYCEGGTGVSVNMSNSQFGVNYQLKVNGTNVGSPVAGTHAAMTWTNVTAAGTATVVGTHATTGCVQTMSGSATISIINGPALFTVGGGGAICTGAAIPAVTLSGSVSGVSYQLKLNGSNTGSPLSGTGSALSWGGLTSAGTYTVEAITISTDCSRTMTGNAVITIYSLPAQFTVGGGGGYCPSGGTTVTLSNSATGVNYQLRIDGANSGSAVAGTGSALSWTSQTTSGTYTIVATTAAAGCIQQMTGSVMVALDPTISGPSSMGANLVTLNSSPGGSYTYQWKRDGDVISGATGSSISATQAGEYIVSVNYGSCTRTSAPFYLGVQSQRYYNGIISSVRWRTDKAYQTADADLKGLFSYAYDEKYQLKTAGFSIPDFTLNTFISGGDKFRVSDLSYDPNGNILSMKRYNATGTIQHNFAYQYNGTSTILQDNKLKSINGYSAYTYNEIGQMTNEDKSGTTDDQTVIYDVTGKVTEVYNGSQIKVVYTYDDRGFRLAKSNMVSGRTTWYIRDGSGNIISIYETDHSTGATSQTEVPVYGSGKIGTYYPEIAQIGSMAYELTDHLGNVRAIIKEKSNVYTATMEDSNEEDLANPRVQEMQYFENLFETEQNSQYMNHTAASPAVTSPSMAAYLFWNDTQGTLASDKSIGPSITLKVDVGDTLKMEAFARYETQTSYTRNMDLALLSSLLGGTFVGMNGVDNVNTVTSMFQNGIGTAGTFFSDTDPTRPYAYLNYMLFDESFAFVDGGAWRVDSDGAFDPGYEVNMNFDHVAFTNPIITTQKGYVYVWVSNESKTTKIWFDDLKVTHSQGVVTQATDYGAWGDVTRESKTAEEKIYRFGYQGRYAERDDETGWSHFQLREFDPVIGRWLTKDPEGQYFSPYVGMGNEPVAGLDPKGGFKVWLHQIIIRDAAKGLYSDSDIELLAKGVAFSDEASDAGLVDKSSYLHFDGLRNFGLILQNYNSIQNEISRVKSSNTATPFHLAFYIHPIQDFYSHSNYVELWMETFDSSYDVKTFGEVMEDKSEWFGLFKEKLRNRLVTGKFNLFAEFFGKSGEWFFRYKYEETHAFLNKDNGLTRAGMIAKDLATRETRKILESKSNQSEKSKK